MASSASSSSPRSEANTSNLSLPELPGIETDPKRPQYTTIAANPLYTSYRDTGLDPMAWNAFGEYNTEGLDAFNLFGVPGYGSALDGETSIDGLLGQPLLDFSGGYANSINGAHSFPSPSSAGLSQITADSPSLYRTPSFTSVSAPSVASVVQTVQSTPDDHSGGCPKTAADVKKMMAGSVPSTFGPPVTTAATSPSAVTVTGGNVESRKADEKDACAHARMAALCADLPRTVKNPNQIEIGRAWEKVRQLPAFEVRLSST